MVPILNNSVFLAGGITNCPDWQAEIVQILCDADSELDLFLYNPRRENYADDPGVEQEQIEWEYIRLNSSTAVLFWFPCETICPIALYELGKFSVKDVPIFIGTHPDYERASDVAIQTKLIRPEVEIVHSIKKLASQVIDYFSETS